MTAPPAAGVIHTDFEFNFIKAEIVSFVQLVEAGFIADSKAKGWARMRVRNTSWLAGM